jgi:hypothetical protein
MPALGYITLAGFLGAIAMLVYDQINMGLVTGSVAMLFWMLLGLRDSYDDPAIPGRRSARISAWAAAWLCLLAGIALFGLPSVVLPKIDPAPFEMEYLRNRATDPRAARRALEEAMARSPRNLELRRQYVLLLRDQFHEPVADQIRLMLSLDKANARPRVEMAMPDSDLPPRERADILRQALELDRQLPADEFKRLPPEMIEQIQQKIRELAPTTQP